MHLLSVRRACESWGICYGMAAAPVCSIVTMWLRPARYKNNVEFLSAMETSSQYGWNAVYEHQKEMLCEKLGGVYCGRRR